MPGLSPTMAVALLVPFTFYLPADTSLILLGAVYTSAVAGGSISAILLSIPGARPPSPPCLTAIPWPSRDVRRKPSTPPFFSSLIGGVVGALALIFLTPPMSEFAMKFGPSELFWTTVFGITVIAGLSSGAMLKGLFGGALGLLLACIGESNVTGEGRFIFHESLTSGIAIVPALIGLFAVPQVVEMMEDSHVIFERVKVQIKEGLLGKVIKKHVHYLRTLTIGSILGTFLPTFVTIPRWHGGDLPAVLWDPAGHWADLLPLLQGAVEDVPGVCGPLVLCAVFGHNGSFAFWEDDLTYEGESVYNYLQVRETEDRTISPPTSSSASSR